MGGLDRRSVLRYGELAKVEVVSECLLDLVAKRGVAQISEKPGDTAFRNRTDLVRHDD
jgi:hypothetical protein